MIRTLPTGSFEIYHPETQRTDFVAPLTLRPSKRQPFKVYTNQSALVPEANNIKGSSLKEFNWANPAQVRTVRYAQVDPKTLPATFIQQAPDQGNCGSCWAVSSTSMTCDRVAIASRTLPVPLNASSITCTQDGCGGGMIYDAYVSLQKGVPADSCAPYKQWCADGFHCNHAGHPACSCQTYVGKKTCPLMAFAVAGTSASFHSISDLQDEIFMHGPVATGFQVGSNLLTMYQCGVKNDAVYVPNQDILGGHAVVIVGWGQDQTGGYWVIRNSWGPTWNGDGFWRFRWNTGAEAEAMAWQAMSSAAVSILGSSSSGGRMPHIVFQIIGGAAFVLLCVLIIQFLVHANKSSQK